jgi:hypothetical protein
MAQATATWIKTFLCFKFGRLSFRLRKNANGQRSRSAVGLVVMVDGKNQGGVSKIVKGNAVVADTKTKLLLLSGLCRYKTWTAPLN